MVGFVGRWFDDSNRQRLPENDGGSSLSSFNGIDPSFRSAGIWLAERVHRRPLSWIAASCFWNDFAKVRFGNENETAARLNLAEPSRRGAQRSAAHIKNADGFVPAVDDSLSSLAWSDL